MDVKLMMMMIIIIIICMYYIVINADIEYLYNKYHLVNAPSVNENILRI